jgi:hypothetical protein
LRKYLIAAVTALAVVATTTAAPAQEQEATMTVKVSPSKAGTTKRPKNSSVRFQVQNNNSQRTLSELSITAPRKIKLSGRGLTKCSESVIESQGASACPRASRVGTGVANALLGVNTGTPTPLTFDVTAVVTGSRSIGFNLRGREIPGLNLLAPGTLSGRTLRIEVPSTAQQPVPGTFAGLVSIDATLKGSKGRNYLVASTGCRNRQHAWSSTLTFINNGVQPAGDVEAEASSRCRK